MKATFKKSSAGNWCAKLVEEIPQHELVKYADDKGFIMLDMVKASGETSPGLVHVHTFTTTGFKGYDLIFPLQPKTQVISFCERHGMDSSWVLAK